MQSARQLESLSWTQWTSLLLHVSRVALVNLAERRLKLDKARDEWRELHAD